MLFKFDLNEVDYIKLSSVVYAYVYGCATDEDRESARELVSNAVATCPDEPGFRKLAEVYDSTGDFPTYGFLAERSLVSLPWGELSALAGKPNRSDAEATLVEARWARAAIDFRNDVDALRDKLSESELHDVTAFMSRWMSDLSLATKSAEREDTAADVYRKRAEMHGGIQFFVKQLDDACQGVEPGTFTVIGGFAGHGKTTFMLNMAYGNAVKWGISSVYVTMEVPKSLLRLWMVARHSLHPKWEGTPPIDRMSIQKGLLTEEQHAHFLVVAEDWENNPDYGRVKVLEWSDFPSFEAGAFIERIRAESPFQAVFVDYMNIFKSYRIPGIKDQYERINYVVEALAKRLALGSSPQIPVVGGAQISRSYFNEYVRRREAGERVGYPLSCFSEANALEKESYYAVALFTDDALKDSGLTLAQLLKHRGGTTIQDPFEARFEPAYVFVGDDEFAGVGEDASSVDISLEDLM